MKLGRITRRTAMSTTLLDVDAPDSTRRELLCGGTVFCSSQKVPVAAVREHAWGVHRRGFRAVRSGDRPEPLWVEQLGERIASVKPTLTHSARAKKLLHDQAPPAARSWALRSFVQNPPFDLRQH